MTKTCRVFPKSLQIGFSAAFYPLKNGLLLAKWEVNCHWHATRASKGFHNQPLCTRQCCLQNCVCSTNISTNTNTNINTNTCTIHQHQHPQTQPRLRVFTNNRFEQHGIVFKRSICLCSISTHPLSKKERSFCVISSRSFNLSTPPSHLNIEEFPTLIIPTQPKSGQLLQNQLANRFNLNFVKTNDLGKGNCGLLPIQPLVWCFCLKTNFTLFLLCCQKTTLPLFSSFICESNNGVANSRKI